MAREIEFYKVLFRPTVVVTTISRNGIANAAPFSFCTPLSFSPPLVGIASSPEHDTWKNIKENGEFVLNVVGENLGDFLWILEKDFPYEVNEIEKAGLTEEKSKRVKPPRIKEAFAWIECNLHNYIETGDHIFIIGKVILAEVKEGYYTKILNVEKAKPICHLTGEHFAVIETISRFKRAD